MDNHVHGLILTSVKALSLFFNHNKRDAFGQLRSIVITYKKGEFHFGLDHTSAYITEGRLLKI